MDYIKMSETAHAKEFHKWLEQQWHKHTHIGNESWQAWTKNIVIMMAKKKAVWVSKWFPDYCVVVKYGNLSATVYVELKKARWVKWWLNWSHVTQEQIDWCAELRNCVGTYVFVCHWHEEARTCVSHIIEMLKSCKNEFDVFRNWKSTKHKDLQDLLSYLEE